jgi:ABC-type multidrug transport system fused ATPase/permease subunit
MKILTNYSRFQRIMSVYTKRDRKKLFLVALSQVFLAFLDLIGVILLGVIGALSVYGIQSKSPGDRTNQILEFVNLSQFSFQQQVAILGSITALILIFKTIISVILVRKTLLFVSRQGALISSNLIRDLFSKSVKDVNRYTNQEIIYTSTAGVENLTARVIGSGLIIFSDLVLLIVLFVGLMFINISISLSIFLMFSGVGFVLNGYMKSSAYKLGTEETRVAIESNEKISEALNSYRELTVSNRRAFYVDKITHLRLEYAMISVKRSFMPNLSKYVFEISLIFGSFLIAGIQFALYSSSQAISSLAIFLAASTRIAPAILRIQQSTIYLRLGLGTVEKTMSMIDFARSGSHDELISTSKSFDHQDFQPSVDIKDLNFRFENNGNFAIENLNLHIVPGSQVAITGSSGAGKSTLIDLILGVFSNDNDSVRISGFTPLAAFARWPGAVAYVPQNINIMNTTIRENISQGYEFDSLDEERVWESLAVAHLDEFVKTLPLGIETYVGEFGNKLSGGQRQRLGIARALFTSPRLLILDESTSALDGETEAHISQTIKELKGKCTVILIAHRLSSVMNADKVIFMENGKITAEGTFSEVRKLSPNFEKQAKLMGITDKN